MTIKEWCEENNISRHKYNYWNHKILTRKELSVEEVEFTEITPILSECDNLLSNLTYCIKMYKLQFQAISIKIL